MCDDIYKVDIGLLGKVKWVSEPVIYVLADFVR